MKRFVFALTDILAIVFALTLFLYGCTNTSPVSLIWGAPAHIPRAKPGPPAIRPSDLYGWWMMTWHGGKGQVVLEPDGRYSCSWRGQIWRGKWSLDDGKFCVCEGVEGSPPT